MGVNLLHQTCPFGNRFKQPQQGRDACHLVEDMAFNLKLQPEMRQQLFVSGTRDEIVKEKFLLLKRILPHHEQMEQLLSSAFDIPQAGLQLVDLPDFLLMLGLFQINKYICFRNLQLTCGSDFSACKPPGFEKAILIRVRELQLLGDLLSFCIGILAGCPFALNFLLVRQIFLAQALDWREDMKEGHCPAVPFYYNNLAVGSASHLETFKNRLRVA